MKQGSVSHKLTICSIYFRWQLMRWRLIDHHSCSNLITFCRTEESHQLKIIGAEPRSESREYSPTQEEKPLDRRALLPSIQRVFFLTKTLPTFKNIGIEYQQIFTAKVSPKTTIDIAFENYRWYYDQYQKNIGDTTDIDTFILILTTLYLTSH